MRAVNTAALALLLAAATAAAQSSSQPVQKPKIVVLTFGGHAPRVLPLAEQTIRELGEKSGKFTAVCLDLYKQPAARPDLSFLTPEFLSKYDGVVCYADGGEHDRNLLTAAQRGAFSSAIEGGKALVGIHGAADLFHDWPEYGELLGAFQDGTPWAADGLPVTIKVEDRDHTACLHLAGSWFLQEAIYQFKAPYQRDKLHVLLSLDTRATDMRVSGINRTDGDFAVSWTKYYGQGRVFYTALGFREDVWRSELFQKHLLGGIRWTLGQVLGKPLPPGTPPEVFITTETGLQYRDVVVGNGKTARRFDKVAVHYAGWLMDGTKFDSSYERGKPIEVVVGIGAVIRAWDEGLIGMKVGGKRKFIAPSHLAYGSRGSGDLIPPHAKLLFELELVEIKKR